MTLATAVIGEKTPVKQIALALGGAAVIAIAAQISIGWPVPMTLQTLAVLLVGLSFGANLGAITVLTYLAYGAFGLPVFANGMAAAAFFGPTAGFLLGFVVMAYVAGLAADYGLTSNPLRAGLVGVLASALVYIPGIAWPMLVAKSTGVEAGWVAQSFEAYYWPHFMAPFLIGDALKAVIAALIVFGGTKALETLRK